VLSQQKLTSSGTSLLTEIAAISQSQHCQPAPAGQPGPATPCGGKPDKDCPGRTPHRLGSTRGENLISKVAVAMPPTLKIRTARFSKMRASWSLARQILDDQPG
jgi:hypothetical protein